MQTDNALPTASFAAIVWESCGLWLVSLMMGLIVVQILLSAGHDATEQARQDDRVSMILGDLAGHLETDLSMGIDPTANGQAQRTISDVYAQHAMLYRVALVNTEGRVIADSDRANIGAHIPDFVITAALSLSGVTPMREDRHRTGQTWAIDQRVHGVAVRNAFDATVGYILIGLPAVSDRATVALPSRRGGLSLSVAAICGLAALGVLGAAWMLSVVMLRRERQREEGPLTLAYEDACRTADARLARMEAALVSLRRNADTP